MLHHTTLADAKKTARHNAKRDECEWVVWYVGNSGWPYRTGTVDERPDYSFWKKVWSTKQDVKALKAPTNENAIILTDEEKELLEAILTPESYDRNLYPGADKVKDSLWKKIAKSLHA